MATYCFVCSDCGATRQANVRTTTGYTCYCGGEWKRDYRAEGVGVQVELLRREREAGGARAVRDKFLPTAKDFAGPSDPDGERGIRQWADEHAPKNGNAKPLWPDMPKKVF